MSGPTKACSAQGALIPDNGAAMQAQEFSAASSRYLFGTTEPVEYRERLDLGDVADAGSLTSANIDTVSESIDQVFNEGEQVDIIVFAFDTDGIPESYTLTVDAL